jgi:hypothetical protein
MMRIDYTNYMYMGQYTVSDHVKVLERFYSGSVLKCKGIGDGGSRGGGGVT